MLIGRYPALLDANVLHPAFVRGALLWFADEGLFQPCWSADIMREWRKSVKGRFSDISDDWLDAKQAQMTEHFPAEVLSRYQIDVIHPDDFIVNIIDLDQARALQACRRHRSVLSNPLYDATQFLERYRASGLIQAREA
jgi:hypothetical protein